MLITKKGIKDGILNYITIISCDKSEIEPLCGYINNEGNDICEPSLWKYQLKLTLHRVIVAQKILSENNVIVKKHVCVFQN